MLMEEFQKPLFGQAEKFFTFQLMNKDGDKEVSIKVLFLQQVKREENPLEVGLYKAVDVLQEQYVVLCGKTDKLPLH